MKWQILSTIMLTTLAIAPSVYSAGPPEHHIRDAYKMLLAQVDADQDGQLSVAECMRIYTSASMAEKNCTYWDADRDGLIKEDEYVRQVQSLGKKR